MRAVRLDQTGHRLNVLLNETEQEWSRQLPRLLAPQGIRTIRVAGVDEAAEIIRRSPIHAAVLEVELPMQAPDPGGGQDAAADIESAGGLKLLRVIQRLEPNPPTVVVRDRRFESRTDDRLLAEALKLHAFTVLDEPVDLEQLLRVLQRLLQRYYGGRWPAPAPGSGDS